MAAATKDRNFYVDDLVKCVDTAQEAKECYHQLVELSGFTLKKWASKCHEVLEIIHSEDHSESNEFLLSAESSSVLGL